MFFLRKKRNLYIHIGHGKTGTTSIQNYLLQNSLNEDCRYLYPKTCRTGSGHHQIYTSEKSRLRQLLEEIDASVKRNIIISSESGLPNMRNFIGEEGYKIDFFKTISKRFNTKIIYYVRNHFDILESAFFQYMESEEPVFYRSILEDNYSNEEMSHTLRNVFFPKEKKSESWIHNIPTRQFDYYANIEYFWRQLFGKNNILTKVYDKQHLLHDDIVQDFINFVDRKNHFLDQTPEQVYYENKTMMYEKNLHGYLLTDEIRDLIRQVFTHSNISYANTYLDDCNADLLLQGFR